jgi:CRP-like cAMP-binding protein
MDGHPDAIRFLSSHPAFVGVDKATVRILASRCRPKLGRPGETLFLEGDPCRDLYILVAGRVKCFRSSPEGREQILKTRATRS